MPRSTLTVRAARSLTGLALPVILALTVRATLVQAYHIPSGSMEGTFFPGDFVFAEKVSFGPTVPGRFPGVASPLPSLRFPGVRAPQRGDLVIFQHPEDPRVDLVKRVVATAGQVVEMRAKQLFVDGQPELAPVTLKHEDLRVQPGQRDNFAPYRVPAGHLFVMGDNRDNSRDSRYFGAVPVASVRARPRVIYFSWDRAAGLRDKIRWAHLGTVH